MNKHLASDQNNFMLIGNAKFCFPALFGVLKNLGLHGH
jgi:hypothetical protein